MHCIWGNRVILAMQDIYFIYAYFAINLFWIIIQIFWNKRALKNFAGMAGIQTVIVLKCMLRITHAHWTHFVFCVKIPKKLLGIWKILFSNHVVYCAFNHNRQACKHVNHIVTALQKVCMCSDVHEWRVIFYEWTLWHS